MQVNHFRPDEDSFLGGDLHTSIYGKQWFVESTFIFPS